MLSGLDRAPSPSPEKGCTVIGRRVIFGVILLALVGATWAGANARNAQVPPEATPGAVGFTGTILGGVDVTVAPGYRLAMAESVFAPGAFVTLHTHPTAIVVCVTSGALGFAIQHGEAWITRGGAEEAELLELNTDVVLEPRDCVSFDHFAAHTSHTGWNASDGETVLMEARLLKTDEPFTTFINEAGTPVAP
jgi:hypothetical protein